MADDELENKLKKIGGLRGEIIQKKLNEAAKREQEEADANDPKHQLQPVDLGRPIDQILNESEAAIAEREKNEAIAAVQRREESRIRIYTEGRFEQLSGQAVDPERLAAHKAACEAIKTAEIRYILRGNKLLFTDGASSSTHLTDEHLQSIGITGAQTTIDGLFCIKSKENFARIHAAGGHLPPKELDDLRSHAKMRPNDPILLELFGGEDGVKALRDGERKLS